MIVLYNPSPNEKTKIIETIDKDISRDKQFLCCVPCNYDRYVIVAIEGVNSCYVDVIEWQTKERVITFEETDLVLDMVTVPGKFYSFS